MNQGDLFPSPQSRRPSLIRTFDAPKPVAANTDPRTSHAAEDWLRRSGEGAKQARETLQALAAWHGDPPTSHELADGNVVLRYAYARRLPELADPERGFVARGPSRPCRVSGREAFTWIVTAKGRRALA